MGMLLGIRNFCSDYIFASGVFFLGVAIWQGRGVLVADFNGGWTVTVLVLASLCLGFRVVECWSDSDDIIVAFKQSITRVFE